jgi:prophage tail gpP-like protein
VQVLNETDTGAVIPNHQIQPGETVFESIDRLMRLRHVLSTDDAAGNLVFVEPGSAGRAVDKLVLGQNALTGAAERDHTGLFSDYVCKGQRAGSDNEFGAAVAQNDGAAQDSTVTRKRVLVLQQSGQADTGTCQDRVEYEKAHRKAKALEAKYSINGWRQSNGVLWRHNMLVHVTDSIIGFDRDLLVSKISYVLDEKGQRLELSVAPPDGFKTKAGKVKAEARKKGGGSSWSELAE